MSHHHGGQKLLLQLITLTRVKLMMSIGTLYHCSEEKGLQQI